MHREREAAPVSLSPFSSLSLSHTQIHTAALGAAAAHMRGLQDGERQRRREAPVLTRY